MDCSTLNSPSYLKWRVRLTITTVPIPFNLFLFIYRVTLKGWDCKDYLKLIKYDDHKVKDFCLEYSLLTAFYMIQLRKYKFKVSRNHEYRETDSLFSILSSLKSHSLWVTLHINQSNFYFTLIKLIFKELKKEYRALLWFLINPK